MERNDKEPRRMGKILTKIPKKVAEELQKASDAMRSPEERESKRKITAYSLIHAERKARKAAGIKARAGRPTKEEQEAYRKTMEEFRAVQREYRNEHK